eukprot:3904760-Rhodomonas_salina.6
MRRKSPRSGRGCPPWQGSDMGHMSEGASRVVCPPKVAPHWLVAQPPGPSCIASDAETLVPP